MSTPFDTTEEESAASGGHRWILEGIDEVMNSLKDGVEDKLHAISERLGLPTRGYRSKENAVAAPKIEPPKKKLQDMPQAALAELSAIRESFALAMQGIDLDGKFPALAQGQAVSKGASSFSLSLSS